jgi:hypothetical protein
MVKKIILFLIKIYQIIISPNLGMNCRFYPTCSSYCCLSIEKYGVLKGLYLSFKRVLKCNPFYKGGIDIP